MQPQGKENNAACDFGRNDSAAYMISVTPPPLL